MICAMCSVKTANKVLPLQYYAKAFPFYHALGLVHKYNDGILSKQAKIKNHCFVTKHKREFLGIFHLGRCGHCIRFNFKIKLLDLSLEKVQSAKMQVL
jgi:hypothetical protein